jgi:hypothetical protein
MRSPLTQPIEHARTCWRKEATNNKPCFWDQNWLKNLITRDGLFGRLGVNVKQYNGWDGCLSTL